MLSYLHNNVEPDVAASRSPRQLWNALLREFYIKKHKRDPSQSPSIMECSPTDGDVDDRGIYDVAVPVNYGMLSYTNQNRYIMTTVSRSPRQLWNALLHILQKYAGMAISSQSPSIMECSPTHGKKEHRCAS